MTDETAKAIVLVLLCALWCLLLALWVQRWDRSADSFRLSCEVEAAKDRMGLPYYGAGASSYRSVFDSIGLGRHVLRRRMRKQMRVRRAG